MCTKFGIAVGVADVIICDKFCGDRLGASMLYGVKNCPFPLTKPVAVNTGLALARDKDLSATVWLLKLLPVSAEPEIASASIV